MAVEFIKMFVATVLLYGITSLAKCNIALGSFVGALPLMSIMSIILLYMDGYGEDHICKFSEALMYMNIPIFTLFIALPWFIRKGFKLVSALPLSIGAMLIFYIFYMLFLKYMNIKVG